MTGIPEVEDDSGIPEKVMEVLEKLANLDFLNFLLVLFRSKIKVLRKTSDLRNYSWLQDIYVNSDLTFAERSERKRLQTKPDMLKKQYPNAEISLRRGKLLLNSDLIDDADPQRLEPASCR